MDKRVFAVDFFDDKLWDNIIDRLGGSGICDNILNCKQYKPCEKVKIYLFSQHQWGVLLNAITVEDEKSLLEILQVRRVTSQSRWWVESSQIRILCLSGNKDNLEIFIMGHEKKGKNYILNKKNFNLNHPIPGQSLNDLIKNGLRTKILEKIDTGYLSPLKRMNDRPDKSPLLKNAVEVKGKYHWLHYRSLTGNKNNEKYYAKQIVQCVDICKNPFFT
jgi:hypothetical protein